jgi:SET domain
VASAIVERSRSPREALNVASWSEVLDLHSDVFDDDIDVPSEVKQITPFLQQNLPAELQSLVSSTAYAFLSRHLTNSFGIWELPISADSENLGSAMYPSASYFNHSCEPNIIKVRQGRTILFVTSREVQNEEELCISYGHTEREVEERREILKEVWGFDCNCVRCIKELKMIE